MNVCQPLPGGSGNGISLRIRRRFLKESHLSVAGGACRFRIFRLQAAAFLRRFHLLTGFTGFRGYLRPGRSRARTLGIPSAIRVTARATASTCARSVSSRLAATTAIAFLKFTA